MKRRCNPAVLALGAIATAGTLVACSDNFPALSPLAPAKQFFMATLTGAAERPNPVQTAASGSSDLTIIDTNTVRVETIVSSIDSVTQAHIHAGTAAEAGPIMVFLFGPVTGTRTGLNGVLSLRDITRGVTAFRSPFTFDSLLTRVRAGTAYVNVHTVRNPGGEIRGQLAPRP